MTTPQSSPDKYVNGWGRDDLGLGRMNRQRFNYFFAVWAGRRREIVRVIIRILFKRQRNPEKLFLFRGRFQLRYCRRDFE